MNSRPRASWWSGLALCGAATGGAAWASQASDPVSEDDLLGLEGEVDEIDDVEQVVEDEVQGTALWLLTPSEGDAAATLLASLERGGGADLGDPIAGRLPSRRQAAAARWVPQVSLEVRAAWGSAAGARQAQDGAVTGWVLATWVPATSRSTAQAAAWERQGLWEMDVEDVSGLRLANLSRANQVAGIAASLSRGRWEPAARALPEEATVAQHVHRRLAQAEWEALHPVAATQLGRGGR